MPTITGPSAESLSTILAQANASASSSRLVVPACEGQLELAFTADRFAFVPRGMVVTQFTPGIGTVNPAPVPSVPLVEMPSVVEMPARVGSAVGLEAVASAAALIAAQLALEWLDRQAHVIGDDLTQAYTCEVDCRHVQLVMGAVETLPLPVIEAETQAQALPCGKRMGRGVKTQEQQKKADDGKRWRLHGYSRKRDNKSHGTQAPDQSPPSNAAMACLSTRKVTHALQQALHAAAVDITATIGAMHGNGGIAHDQAWVYDSASGRTVRAGADHESMGLPVDTQWQSKDAELFRSQWIASFPDAPPDNFQPGNPKPAPGWVTEIQGRAKLITMEAARKVIDVVFDKFGAKIDQALSKDSTYRAFNVRELVKNRVSTLRWKVESALIEQCFGTARVKTRTGPQLVSTRRDLSDIRPFTWFRFSGYDAFRAGPGRPPLPEAEWKRRYQARLKKRNKTGRHRKGKGVKVPDTRWHWRPRQILDLTHK